MRCFITIYPHDFKSTEYANALSDAVCKALWRRFPDALQIASYPLAFYIKDSLGVDHFYPYFECTLEPDNVYSSVIFKTWDNSIEDILQENYRWTEPIKVVFSFNKHF